jgi:DNA-directed RNA polymerase specialized sigma24 family protein
MMDDEVGGSVTHWLGDLQHGNVGEATQRLWGRYFDKLARLARAKLPAAPRGSADEEDVALSALQSFFEGAVAGQFERLDDRDDLWRLLVTITARKALNQRRREHQLKRGGGRVVGEDQLDRGDPNGHRALAEILGKEPTPEFAALIAEECRSRLDGLRDDTLRQVALMRMEGYTNAEIAARTRGSLRSVERKLELIRKRWQAEDGS